MPERFILTSQFEDGLLCGRQTPFEPTVADEQVAFVEIKTIRLFLKLVALA